MMLCMADASHPARYTDTLCPQPGFQVPPHMWVAENRPYEDSQDGNDSHHGEDGT
jgi:hypothetical protein